MEPFLEEVRLILSRMLAGDFTTPVMSVASDDSCREIVELLEKTREMFLRFEKDLGATVAQIASVVAEVQRIVTQTQRIFEDSAKLEELTAFLDSAFGKLSSTIQAGERGIIEIDVAFSSFEHLFRSIEELAQGVQGYLEKIEHTLEGIGSVFRRVHDIADHTRLVAINASIEAARAGVYGQAFSAVARAIRDLAEKSAQIAVDTSQTVSSFQEDIRTMLLEMVRSHKEISVTMQRAYSGVMKGLGKQRSYMEDVLNEIRTMHVELRHCLSEIRASFKQWEEAISALRRAANLLEKVEAMTQSSLVLQGNLASFRLGNEEVLWLIEELQNLARSPEIRNLDADLHYHVLRQFLEAHPSLEAIYTTRKDGTFIASIPPAGLANAKIRPWWQEAMKGQAYVSEVYVSAITREPCVTVSVPIPGMHGEFLGVLGADISLGRKVTWNEEDSRSATRCP